MSDTSPEALLASLLQEVWDSHRDKDSANYNECEKDECQWCVETREALAAFSRITTKEQPVALRVSAYQLAPTTHDGGPHRHGVQLVLVEGMHGDRWAIRHGTDCLNRDLEWEWEPLPSSRDDAFFARCRFESAETGARLWSAYLSNLGVKP